MKQTVFVPVGTEQLRRLADDPVSGTGLTPEHAYAATEELQREFGYGPDEQEDADYAAQALAGVQALLSGQPRLVLAAECEASDLAPAEPADHGAVRLDQLSWTQVRAIFVEDPGAADEATRLADELSGQALDSAWADERVRQFVADHELLWFATQEHADALALVEA